MKNFTGKETSHLPKPFYLNAEDIFEAESSEFRCGNCSLQFSSLLELSIHQYSDKNHEGMVDSGILFLTAYNINVQLYNDASQLLMSRCDPQANIGDEYCCKYCNKNFVSFKGIQQHIGKMHQISPREVKCDICLKSFKNKNALKFHHHQVHEKSTRVLCEFCHKLFYNKYALAAHINTCIGKKESQDT
ncbi:unnamed protein product [Blepharisma stoltei]|uniref:C2H2-type domain-containing protein n=1 Tax=Blepharisma stoltei TaxID=1481888 RepID=A0AAU9IVL2_9CILI|nr:unnamed protein product [Blepharisma stoltei]